MTEVAQVALHITILVLGGTLTKSYWTPSHTVPARGVFCVRAWETGHRFFVSLFFFFSFLGWVGG